MDVCAQLLKPFLVLHAEFLFLVDDKQPKVLELDRFCQQRMGTDYDVHGPFGQPLTGEVRIPRGHKT